MTTLTDLREALEAVPTAQDVQARIDRIRKAGETVSEAAPQPAARRQIKARWPAIAALVLIVIREVAVNLPVIAKTHLTLNHANALCNSQLGVFARAFDHIASNDCVNVTIWYTAFNVLAVLGALSAAVAIALFLRDRRI